MNNIKETGPTRSVSFGVYGRTGKYDEIPTWDIVPHACDGYDEKMPHGGKSEEYCKKYKKINTKFPEIAKEAPKCFKEKFFPTVDDL